MYPRMIWCNVQLFNNKIVKWAVTFRPWPISKNVKSKSFYVRDEEEMESISKKELNEFLNQWEIFEKTVSISKT